MVSFTKLTYSCRLIQGGPEKRVIVKKQQIAFII